MPPSPSGRTDQRSLKLKKYSCFFVDSSYPKWMVEEIVQKVKHKPRELGYRDQPDSEKRTTPWIITFGAGYEDSKKKADELNRIFENSNTRKELPYLHMKSQSFK